MRQQQLLISSVRVWELGPGSRPLWKGPGSASVSQASFLVRSRTGPTGFLVKTEQQSRGFPEEALPLDSEATVNIKATRVCFVLQCKVLEVLVWSWGRTRGSDGPASMNPAAH